MDILVADDSNTSRTLIKTILNKLGFNVIEAVDGQDAWEKLQQENPPKILLVDWSMPRMDGIELSQKIRDKETKNEFYTYIIMLTANDEEMHTKEGFDAGVDNFLTKPINVQALNISLTIAKRIITQQNNMHDIKIKLEQQLLKQKKEIKKAQEIQQFLNTSIIPQMNKINIKAVYNPSQEMGGDFFNIIKTVRNNLVILMVDCTGHGLEASMYATLLKSICDRHINILDNPQFLLNFVQMVNIDAAGYITTDQFPVMFVSVLDTTNMKFYYCSANGEHPYLIRKSKVQKVPRVAGMHLGYNTESHFQVKSFKIENNDTFMFYSDAIIEIPYAPWNRDDDTILKAELAKETANLEELNTNVMNLLRETTQSTKLTDDLSLIFLQFSHPYTGSKTLKSKNDIRSEIDLLSKNLIKYDYNKNEIGKICIEFNEQLLNILSEQIENSIQLELKYSISFKSVTITTTNLINSKVSTFNRNRELVYCYNNYV
ncbi:MAG: response regulator [Spirochaetales bacterium]|nr:response regulator [Spirochaetales bacterium]